MAINMRDKLRLFRLSFWFNFISVSEILFGNNCFLSFLIDWRNKITLLKFTLTRINFTLLLTWYIRHIFFPCFFYKLFHLLVELNIFLYFFINGFLGLFTFFTLLGLIILKCDFPILFEECIDWGFLLLGESFEVVT